MMTRFECLWAAVAILQVPNVARLLASENPFSSNIDSLLLSSSLQTNNNSNKYYKIEEFEEEPVNFADHKNAHHHPSKLFVPPDSKFPPVVDVVTTKNSEAAIPQNTPQQYPLELEHHGWSWNKLHMDEEAGGDHDEHHLQATHHDHEHAETHSSIQDHPQHDQLAGKTRKLVKREPCFCTCEELGFSKKGGKHKKSKSGKNSKHAKNSAFQGEMKSLNRKNHGKMTALHQNNNKKDSPVVPNHGKPKKNKGHENDKGKKTNKGHENDKGKKKIKGHEKDKDKKSNKEKIPIVQLSEDKPSTTTTPPPVTNDIVSNATIALPPTSTGTEDKPSTTTKQPPVTNDIVSNATIALPPTSNGTVENVTLAKLEENVEKPLQVINRPAPSLIIKDEGPADFVIETIDIPNEDQQDKPAKSPPPTVSTVKDFPPQNQSNPTNGLPFNNNNNNNDKGGNIPKNENITLAPQQLPTTTDQPNVTIFFPETPEGKNAEVGKEQPSGSPPTAISSNDVPPAIPSGEKGGKNVSDTPSSHKVPPPTDKNGKPLINGNVLGKDEGESLKNKSLIPPTPNPTSEKNLTLPATKNSSDHDSEILNLGGSPPKTFEFPNSIIEFNNLIVPNLPVKSKNKTDLPKIPEAKGFPVKNPKNISGKGVPSNFPAQQNPSRNGRPTPFKIKNEQSQGFSPIASSGPVKTIKYKPPPFNTPTDSLFESRFSSPVGGNVTKQGTQVTNPGKLTTKIVKTNKEINGNIPESRADFEASIRGSIQTNITNTNNTTVTKTKTNIDHIDMCSLISQLTLPNGKDLFQGKDKSKIMGIVQGIPGLFPENSKKLDCENTSSTTIANKTTILNPNKTIQNDTKTIETTRRIEKIVIKIKILLEKFDLSEECDPECCDE